MGRKPCCEKTGLNRGPWTIEEDHKLLTFILNNGIHCWRMVPKLAGLSRCGKSCRLRWVNYLRPDLKRGAFSEAEEDQIIQLHERLGNRWSKIASYLPGRTDNEIKNHWNTRIKKKLKLKGLDPGTHKPILIEQKETKITEAITNSKENRLGFGHKETIDDHVFNYDLLYQNFDIGMPTSQVLPNTTHTKNFSTGTPLSKGESSSFSLEDSTTTSLSKGESSSIQEEFIHQWVDNVDSILTWDGFQNDDFLFMGDYII